MHFASLSNFKSEIDDSAMTRRITHLENINLCRKNLKCLFNIRKGEKEVYYLVVLLKI